MLRRLTWLIEATAIASLLVLVACTTDDTPPPEATRTTLGAPQREVSSTATPAPERTAESSPAFTLQLLHASDMDERAHAPRQRRGLLRAARRVSGGSSPSAPSS